MKIIYLLKGLTNEKSSQTHLRAYKNIARYELDNKHGNLSEIKLHRCLIKPQGTGRKGFKEKRESRIKNS